MSFKTLFSLILVNLIWSAHPAMGKLVLHDFGPVMGAWLRYASALLSYVLAMLAIQHSGLAPERVRERFRTPWFRPSGRREWALVSALGFMTFCFSPVLQMTGLAASRALDNALIIAIEPLMTVLLARLILGERLTLGYVGAFGVAMLGFVLLTGLSVSSLTQGMSGHLLGNIIILVSLTGEAAYSSLGRKLVARHPPLGVFGTALAAGVVFLTLVALAHFASTVFSVLSISATL